MSGERDTFAPLIAPVTLANEHVRLEPLAAEHAAELREAAAGLEYAWYTSVPTSIDAEIAQRLSWRDAAHMNPGRSSTCVRARQSG